MSENSKIEWTDATWNPVVARRLDTGKIGYHCEKVSPACTHCYAATINRRNLPARGTGLDYTKSNRERVKIELHADTLTKPLHWKKPRKVFVCSMTDLFGEFVPFELIDQVFAWMAMLDRHTFQVLTKRPERMAEYLGTERDRHINESGRQVFGEAITPVRCWPLPNVWLGTTVEDQQRADERIPHLLECPAAVRFVSYEPALGPVHFGDYFGTSYRVQDEGDPETGDVPYNHGLHWIICGGESGRDARPMHPDWARSVRDQCAAAGVPFLFKQWGEHVMPSQMLNDVYARVDAAVNLSGTPDEFYRVGKKKSGRLLDGREHSEFPESVTV